ncbi:MAG: DUF2232 domain-containing protein [Deltaproteobacteria bacterium]|nr:DUF2232 domain-containing protein [Deltaproteobacteria bacterium]
MREQFKEIALSFLVTALLYLSGFFSLWTPLPLFYVGLQKNPFEWRRIFAVVALLSLILAFSLKTYGILFYLFIAYCLHWGAINRHRIFSWSVLTAFVALFIIYGIGLLLQFSGLVDITGRIDAVMNQTVTTLETMSQQPEFQKEGVDVMGAMEVTKSLFLFLPKLFPAFLFIYTVFVLLVNIAILKAFRRTAPLLLWVEDFRSLQVPVLCLWTSIGAGLIYFANHYLFQFGWLEIALLNILLVLSFIYLLQGLAVVSFFLRKVPFFLRLTVYGLLFFFIHILGLITVGLGLADTWFNFRTKEKV